MKIDISPVSRGNMFKLSLYLFAAFNLAIFIGKDLSARECFYKDQNGQTICRHTESISSHDFIIENFELFTPTTYIVHSSLFNLKEFSRPNTSPKGRSPPF